jgi:hypothetical protein
MLLVADAGGMPPTNKNAVVAAAPAMYLFFTLVLPCEFVVNRPLPAQSAFKLSSTRTLRACRSMR